MVGTAAAWPSAWEGGRQQQEDVFKRQAEKLGRMSADQDLQSYDFSFIRDTAPNKLLN
jgi:hypothetical protein